MRSLLFVVINCSLTPMLALGNDPEWRQHLEMADEQLVARDLLQAEIHLQSAWKLAEQFGPKDPRLAYTALKLGGVYVELQHFEAARQLYEFALPIFHENESEGWVQRAYAYRQLADLDFAEGKLERAKENYLKALKIYDTNDQQKGLARAALHFGLARTYRHQQKTSKAEPHAITAICLLDAEPEKPDNTATILAELGHVYLLKGDLPKAETVFKEALKQAKQTHDENHRETAYLLDSYALLLRRTGRSKLADDYVSRARQIERDSH